MVAERRISTKSIARKEPLEYVLSDTILINIDGVWTVFYNGSTYIALLDASSREDALTQIAEMMFMKVGVRPNSSLDPDRITARSC